MRKSLYKTDGKKMILKKIVVNLNEGNKLIFNLASLQNIQIGQCELFFNLWDSKLILIF